MRTLLIGAIISLVLGLLAPAALAGDIGPGENGSVYWIAGDIGPGENG